MTDAPRRPLSRRAGLVLPLGLMLAGCMAARPEPAQTFEPLDFGYLTKLKLNVARIDIDDSWTPRAGTRQVGYLSPTSPVDALRLMAQQRLLPAGSAGRALFTIADASIVAGGGRYTGSFAVRLDLATSDGQRTGFAEAVVSRTAAVDDASPAGQRAALDTLVRQMMAAMNVELEFQVRRSLRDTLMPDETTSPLRAPVQTQDLGPIGTRPPPQDLAPLAPPLSGAPAAPPDYGQIGGPQPLYPPPADPYATPYPYAAPSTPQPLAPPVLVQPLPPGTQPLLRPTPLSP